MKAPTKREIETAAAILRKMLAGGMIAPDETVEDIVTEMTWGDWADRDFNPPPEDGD